MCQQNVIISLLEKLKLTIEKKKKLYQQSIFATNFTDIFSYCLHIKFQTITSLVNLISIMIMRDMKRLE